LDLLIQLLFCFSYLEGLFFVNFSFKNFLLSKLVGRQIRERFGEKPSNIAGIEQPFVFALLKSVASPNLQV